MDSKAPITFKNFGGIYQMRIETADDLAHIQKLDEARWAATSAPVKDLQCDPVFLNCLDAAGTGRIRLSDIIAARDWMFRNLANRSHVHEKTEILRLADIDAGAEGRDLRGTAEHILDEIGAPERLQISLAQVRAFRASYVDTLANGDGILCPEVVPDPETAEFVKEILPVVGGTPDASGRQGIGVKDLDKLIERGQAWLDWKAVGSSENPDHATVLPWGADTAAAWARVKEWDPIMESWFWQSDLVRQSPQASEHFQPTESVLKDLPVQDAEAIRRHLGAAPLTQPAADGILPLNEPVNPFFEESFEVLRQTVLARINGPKVNDLTRERWRGVKALFTPYEAWQAARPTEPFDTVSDEKIKEWISGDLSERARRFIDEDLAAAPDVERAAHLEKLILYQRWLLELSNNFVNFSAIYDPRDTALFEMGTLILDGRRLQFTMRVDNREAHKKLAAESKIFLVYASIYDKDPAKPVMEIAAPVTAGERGRIVVGKRGVFLTHDGQVHDAVVVEIIENPISLWEAIKAPFKRVGEFVSGKIEEFASSKAKAAETGAITQISTASTTVATTATSTSTTAKTTPTTSTTPTVTSNPTALVSLMAGGGLAIAALGSAAAYLVSAMSQVEPLSALSAIAALVLTIVAFSALVGYFKLRKRDMGLLMEASGWAINLHMKLTLPVSHLFTRTPALPQGSRRESVDITTLFQEPEEEEEGGINAWRIGLGVIIGLLITSGIIAWYYWDALNWWWLGLE